MNSLSHTASSTNGETSVQDLFALSDEQILEIEAEPQDIEIADVYLDDEDRAVLVAPASSPEGLNLAGGEENRRLEAGATGTLQAADGARESGEAARHQSQASAHDLSEPPQWLADRMSDPQVGGEARALWDSVQQSKAEAAGFREIFAKPEEARAAAQRARLLDDIDRAYFGGNTTQRASLAASMLREDPAAFREMVFAGLRALEEGAQASNARGDASPRAQQATSNTSAGNSGSSASPNSRVNDALAEPPHGSLASRSALTQPKQAERDSTASRAVAPSQSPEAADASAASASSTHRISSDSARDASNSRENTSPEAERSASQTAARSPHSAQAATSDHIAANYAAFERSTNDDLERIVGSSIDRTLDRALPHSNRADNAAMRTRLAASIRQDIERSLQDDRQLGEQVSQVLSARRLDETTRSQVVRLIGERAQQLVPATTRRVLGEWTQTTLAAHRERGGRSDALDARRNAEPAISANARSTTASTSATNAQHSAATTHRGTSSRRPAQPTSSRSQRVDYRRVSDEQILDW
jgi:hypothetical protein